MTEATSKKQIDRSRRKFIKYSGFLGAFVSTTSLSSVSCKQNETVVESETSDCRLTQLPNDFIYLNTGTEGSMPQCVLTSLQKSQREWARYPTIAYETDKIFGKHQHHNREEIANFFSVEKNNITLTGNTTMGLSMVIMGLNFKPGDKIIITNHEHNAIASPVAVLKEKLGIAVDIRPFPTPQRLAQMNAAELLNHLFPNTAELRGATALCVSHVYPGTGVQLPLNLLRRKAEELGIKYLIIDGAQAFGMLDLTQGDNHITHADFYACPGHKWLNGPPGTGILYLKDALISPPEFYPVLSQRMGQYNINQQNDDETFPMAEALQVRGCSNVPGYAAMLTALKNVRNIGGPQGIQLHILDLSKNVKNFIVSKSPEAMVSPYKDDGLQSGLTVFFPFKWSQPDQIFRDQKTADFVVSELNKRNLRIRSIGFNAFTKPGQKDYALRVSTGIFNNRDQLDYFQVALKEVLSSI